MSTSLGSADGFKELAQALQALPDRMATQVLSGAARKGAKVIEDAMVQKAPAGSKYAPSKAHEEYGSIRDNIKVKSYLRERDRVIFQIGIDKAFWAHWIEFGRLGSKIKKKKVLSNQQQFFGKEVAAVPAHPFARPALDENADKAVATTIVEMGKGLSRVVARLVADYGTARKSLLSKSQRF